MTEYEGEGQVLYNFPADWRPFNCGLLYAPEAGAWSYTSTPPMRLHGVVLS